MKPAAFSRGLGVVVVAVATLTSSGTAAKQEGNPLATWDQRNLDALAIQINNEEHFVTLKAKAKSSYQTAHGPPISQEAASRLNAAIDELAFSAIQKAVNNDTLSPKVYWVDAGPRKWFGLDVPGGRYSYDNPDCIYRTIPIDSRFDYVIKGHRHTPGPADVTFSLISNPNSQKTVTKLADKDLVVNHDGSYIITINNSTSKGRINHIQSSPMGKQLLIRNNLENWLSQRPDNLTVELVNHAPRYSAISKEDIITVAARNLQESILNYGLGALKRMTMSNAVNTLSNASQSSTLGTLTTQASSYGYFNLTADDALVVTVNPGSADYFVVPVTDPWMITVDPGIHQVSLNNAQSIPNANGTYTFVVSLKDPRVHNWIDTAGLHEGTIMVRWQGLTLTNNSSWASPHKSHGVNTQVVPFYKLASALPNGTHVVTPKERAAQLAQRIRGYTRRLAF